MSELALKLIAENKRTKNPSLDLGNCGLTDLNEIKNELFELKKHLINLSFKTTYYDKIYQRRINTTNQGRANNLTNFFDFSPLRRLEILRLGVDEKEYHDSPAYILWSRISAFEFKASINLRVLDMTGLRIFDAENLIAYKSLLSLDLSSNEIYDINFIKELSLLKWLSLSNNKIHDINSIRNLFRLVHLELNNNEIEDLNACEGLYDLRYLDLSYNQIVDILPLRDLTQLNYLDLKCNRITKVPNTPDWGRVEYMDLSENKLVSFRIMASLPSLVGLNINTNRVSKIDHSIYCPNLRSLDMGYNQIANFYKTIYAPELTYINISKNKIQDISSLVEYYKKTNVTIVADSNPLINPPKQVFIEGRLAIISFFELKRKILNDQVKCIFLGNSTVGKTSIIKFLKDKTYDRGQITTHGILQTNWKISHPDKSKNLSDIHLNIWDFGGQHYYHSMHRLFLTRGAVYTLVCTKDLDKNDRSDIQINLELPSSDSSTTLVEPVIRSTEHFSHQYWLNSIDYYDNAQPTERKSAVHLVQSKFDYDQMEADPSYKLHILSETKRNHNDLNIHDFIPLNIDAAYLHKEGEPVPEDYQTDFKKFENQLIRSCYQQLEKQEIPARFPDVRDLLNDWTTSAQLAVWRPETHPFFKDRNISTEPISKPPVPFMSDESFKDLIRALTRDDDHTGTDFEGYYNLLIIYLESMTGSIAYFRDVPWSDSSHSSPNDRGLICIRPQWLHDTIFHILDHDIVAKGSSFQINQIEKHIQGGGITAVQMIHILKKLDLIFEYKAELPLNNNLDIVEPARMPIEKSTWYLSPHTLPYDRPQVDQRLFRGLSNVLTIQFPEYIPPDIIARFIAREGSGISNIHEAILWKYGVHYYDDLNDLTIFLMADTSNSIILLQTNDLVNNDIGPKTLNFLKRFSRIFLQDICDNNNQLVLQLTNAPKVSWGAIVNASRDARLAAVDNVVIEPGFYRELIPENNLAPKVFISYTHQDKDLVSEFCNVLETLKSQGRVESWIDDQIEPSEPNWENRLIKEINTSDIMICLLTNEYLNENAHPVIYQTELKTARDKVRTSAQNPRPFKIIPLLFKICHFEGSDFSKSQILNCNDPIYHSDKHIREEKITILLKKLFN